MTKVKLQRINLSVKVLQEEVINKPMKPVAAFHFLSLVDEVNSHNTKLVEAYNKCQSKEEKEELLNSEVEITHSIPSDYLTFDISPAGLSILKPFIV